MSKVVQLPLDKTDRRTEEILEALERQWDKAHADGAEGVDHFFTTAAFTIGTFLPYSVSPEGIVPSLAQLVEALTAGVHAGLEMNGVKSTFIKIVKD